MFTESRFIFLHDLWPSRRLNRRLLVASVASLFLAGCAVGPNYQKPPVATPDGFEPASIVPTTQPTTLPAADALVDPENWWASLQDAELDSLVERAMKNNSDVRVAAVRLQQARTAESVVLGGGLPAVDISLGAGRGTGTNTARSRVAGPLHAGTNTTGLQEITEVAGFDTAWEIDLFGHFQRSLEASHADTQAAAELRSDVLVSVISDVARAYVDARSLQIRLDIANENIARQQRSVDLARSRYRQGLTNELDVVLAERQLSTVRAQVAPLQAALEEARSALAVLIDVYPADLDREMFNPAPLPQTPAPAMLGLPADLLRRRPDIRARERQLAAATARLGIAVSDLYPRVAITGGIGFQGQGLGRTPVENSLVWSIGPTIYWPLFDFGRLDALVQLQDFRTQEVMIRYRQSILLAVHEVQNSITGYAAERDRLAELARAVTSSRRAFHLATQRYERGLSDFLNVLDAQRQLYDLEDQYAVGEQTALVRWISVYKALGGGWRQFAAPPPPAAPRPAVIAAADQFIHPNGSASLGQHRSSPR